MKLRFNVCENFHPYAHTGEENHGKQKNTLFQCTEHFPASVNGEEFIFESFETFIEAVKATLRYLSTILSLFSYLEQWMMIITLCTLAVITGMMTELGTLYFKNNIFILSPLFLRLCQSEEMKEKKFHESHKVHLWSHNLQLSTLIIVAEVR